MTSSGPNPYPQGVGAESNMSLAIAKTLIPSTARPVEPGIEEGDASAVGGPLVRKRSPGSCSGPASK